MQLSGIADLGRQRPLTRLFNVQRHGVDEQHLVAPRGEPHGIISGSAADVQHPKRRGLKDPADQLRRPPELKRTSQRAIAEPRRLPTCFIEGEDFGAQIAHGPISAHLRRPASTMMAKRLMFANLN
ncbi:MAG: hypothetical protein JO168_08420 [Solirubrobacterales bacterium]|nr:hypothetical protein [Solirubrobacterales bacterium]